MSKKNNESAPETSNASLPPGLEGAIMVPPPSLEKASSDVVGFWDEEAGYPIYGRLLFAREIIPKKGASKGLKKRYYVMRLGAPTMLAENPDKGQVQRPGKRGDIVGVWARAGSADLNRKQGCVVWMTRNPKSEWKDVGRPELMITYDIRTEGEGKKIEVIPFNEDTNTDSEMPAASNGGIPLDQIPF